MANTFPLTQVQKLTSIFLRSVGTCCRLEVVELRVYKQYKPDVVKTHLSLLISFGNYLDNTIGSVSRRCYTVTT